MECIDGNTEELRTKRRQRGLDTQIRELKLTNNRLQTVNDALDVVIKVMLCVTAINLIRWFFR